MFSDSAQVAARYVVAFALILLYLYFFKKAKAKVPRAKLGYAIALGIAFAATVLFFTLSVQKTTIANSLFTLYAANLLASFCSIALW